MKKQSWNIMCKRNKKQILYIGEYSGSDKRHGDVHWMFYERRKYRRRGYNTIGYELSQMSGNWQIDFDKTEAVLWGSGSLQGNSMEISETGAFSYYIGIGVGGTGQCEEEDGVITVKVEPYEAHSLEQEILTLKYESANGTEIILMDWNDEDVYWVRDAQTDSMEKGIKTEN